MGVEGVGGDEKADLDLGLDIVDGVAALDLERDGLPRERLDEDLHLAGYDPRSGARVLPRQVAASPDPNEGSCGVD